MLYVNGAFRDSLKDGTVTRLIPNKQARLTIGRKSGNPPFKYTRYVATTVWSKVVMGVILSERQVLLEGIQWYRNPDNKQLAFETKKYRNKLPDGVLVSWAENTM